MSHVVLRVVLSLFSLMSHFVIRVVLALAVIYSEVDAARKVHTIHWESRNPIFRIDNTDHIIDVNQGNIPFEYDQVNIVCPSFEDGSPTRSAEQYIIYSVSKEEYDTCRITNPKPRIIAVCDRPDQLRYFTITFRSFTPQPGGLEFRPGQDYYFISTSSRDDLHRRVGGHCRTHNMKVVFKVCCKNENTTPAPEVNDELEDSNSVDFVRPPSNMRPTQNRTSDVVVALPQPETDGQDDASNSQSFGGPDSDRVDDPSLSDDGGAGYPSSDDLGFRPYGPRVAQSTDRPPSIWRPRWSAPSTTTRRPWFPTSTSRSTSYKNFGFPVFSVKSRPPPKQTDYLYKLEKDLLRRQELLRSHSSQIESSSLLLTCSVLLGLRTLISLLRHGVG